MTSDTSQGTTWYDACAVEDVPDGEGLALPLQPPLAVFHVDGEFHATDDTCTHAESSLAEGFIEGATVECEFHFATFCLRTGAALTRPATIPLRVYPVRIDGGRVLVDITSRSADQAG